MVIFTLATPMFRPLKAFLNYPQNYIQEKAATLFWMFWILQNPFPSRYLLNFGTISSQCQIQCMLPNEPKKGANK